jgi:lysozyme family protein
MVVSDAFNRAVRFVLDHEGGYDNDPDDPGGETKFGIDARSHPGVDIRNLTESDAVEIYRRTYWAAIRGDDLPYPLSLVVMDAAVNCGISWSSKTLQRIVKSTPDGIIGAQTLAAIAMSPLPIMEICRLHLIARRDRYTALIATNPKLKKYLAGWMRRVVDLVFMIMEG